MAKSTKNTALVAGMESEIGKLSDSLPEDALAILEESKAKALHIVAVAVAEYRKAELTEEQKAELTEAESRLADIDATEESAQSDLLLEWRQEEDKRMAKAPKKEYGKVLLAVHAERAKALADLVSSYDTKREEDSAIVAKLSNVKGETAKTKALEYLGHTFGGSITEHIRPPIQGNDWLFTDILTSNKLTGCGRLDANGVYWFYPIGEDWRKPLSAPFALEPDTWHSVGALPVADLNSATDAQGVHYRAIDRMKERKSLADLHAHLVGLISNNNLDTKRIGGSRGVTHIVAELQEPGYVRQVTLAEFQEQYHWPTEEPKSEEPTEEPTK